MLIAINYILFYIGKQKYKFPSWVQEHIFWNASIALCSHTTNSKSTAIIIHSCIVFIQICDIQGHTKTGLVDLTILLRALISCSWMPNLKCVYIQLISACVWGSGHTRLLEQPSYQLSVLYSSKTGTLRTKHGISHW